MKSHPRELGLWMKNNRKLNHFPKIVKPTDYIVSWRWWWCLLQPEWRKSTAAWPPSRDIPEDGYLTTMAQSGPNGFFLIVLSLSWWGKLVVNGSADLTEFETAVDDILWVLSHQFHLWHDWYMLFAFQIPSYLPNGDIPKKVPQK
jgi:hypothetical protein